MASKYDWTRFEKRVVVREDLTALYLMDDQRSR